VDLELSDGQVDLRDGFRRQLAGICTTEVRRAALNSPGAVDRVLWGRLGDAGVFTLTTPGADGGLGAGLAEAVIVHEEIGRAAVPGPVVTTAVVAGTLPGARDGSIVVATAFAADPVGIVEHLAGSDLVAIMSPERFVIVPAARLLDGPEGAQALTEPLDPLTPLHRWNGSDWPEGTLGITGPEAEAAWEAATLLTAATSVGLGAVALDTATAYAKERRQFDRPIGSFQAVKHLLADALAGTEIARAAVHAAAVSCDEAAPAGERQRLVAVARNLASRAAQRATRAAIQVHGGMGYTWEMDAHLFLKRALVLDTHFETPDASRHRLAATL
jgi:alkylation response protein AidB-like acyl-CoA dehydrogenase